MSHNTQRVYMAMHLRRPVGEWRIICGSTSRATTYRPVIFAHIWQRNAAGGSQ